MMNYFSSRRAYNSGLLNVAEDLSLRYYSSGHQGISLLADKRSYYRYYQKFPDEVTNIGEKSYRLLIKWAYLGSDNNTRHLKLMNNLLNGGNWSR